jgi:hypothetical protein
MDIKKIVLFLPLALLCAFLTACGESTPSSPTISLSSTRIPAKGNLNMNGAGFTPKGALRSHLRRPDGTEFPEMPIIADDSGKFTHEIETLLLGLGTHELWVIDDAKGVTSNTATFEVTLDQPPPAN